MGFNIKLTTYPPLFANVIIECPTSERWKIYFHRAMWILKRWFIRLTRMKYIGQSCIGIKCWQQPGYLPKFVLTWFTLNSIYSKSILNDVKGGNLWRTCCIHAKHWTVCYTNITQLLTFSIKTTFNNDRTLTTPLPTYPIFKNWWN